MTPSITTAPHWSHFLTRCGESPSGRARHTFCNKIVPRSQWVKRDQGITFRVEIPVCSDCAKEIEV